MDKETEQSETLTPSAGDIKTKQRRLFWLLVGSIIGLLILLLIHWLTKDPPQKSETVSQTAPVYDVSRQVEDKSYWMYKSEQILKEQSKTQENLQKKVEELEGKLLRAAKLNSTEQPNEQTKQLDALLKRVEQLESPQTKRLEADENTSHTMPHQQWTRPARTKFINQGMPQNETDKRVGSSVPLIRELHSPAIFSEKLSLSPKPEDLKSKPPNIDHYIPVGTFARAVLLNGVDVSVGVSAQQNPQPVLLRLVDKGNLPNGAVGDMKDCRIIAAAHGDYSSERALVRIEKLSCVQKDDSVIETDVGGFVVGTDGKAGLRGPMITRDGELLTQGFISGLFSGLGKAVSSATGTSSMTPFGSINTVQGKDIIKKAGSEGVGNAFEILSRYAIKRLEQLQPVIQISANREVDIVFHTGSQFGEKKERVVQPSKESNEVKFGDFGISD